MERRIERIKHKMKIRKKTSKIGKAINAVVAAKTAAQILKTIGIRQSLGAVNIIGWLVVARAVYTTLKNARA